MDKSKLVSQERHSKTGGHWTAYRLDNEDIYSQVNTILKMAKKRALVDAALSAGRLSDVFTQDIEDMPDIVESEPKQPTTQPKAKSMSTKKDTTMADGQDNTEPQPIPEPQPEPSPSIGQAPKTADELYDWLAVAKGWKDVKPAHSFLVNKCHIDETRIFNDPAGVYEEVKDLI
jgi:hypothetical protein